MTGRKVQSGVNMRCYLMNLLLLLLTLLVAASSAADDAQAETVRQESENNGVDKYSFR